MNNQIIQKLREIKESTSIEQGFLAPDHLRSLCKDIKSLSEQVNSVMDMDFLMETLEMTSSLLDNQYSGCNEIWKKNFNEMAAGLLNEITSGTNESGWKGIEDRLSGIFPDSLSVPFLYNRVKTDGLEINAEERENDKMKKARIKRTQENKQTSLTKPIQVLSQGSSNADSYKTKMQVCLEKLYEACSFDENVEVPFFQFAINCKSYIQSIYNIFTLSFLIREHLAVMSVDQNCELWIRPARKYKKKNGYVLNSSQNHEEFDSTFQMVLSINPKEWKMLIKAFGMNSTMLPVMWPQNDFLRNNKSNYQSISNGVHFME